MASSHAEAIVKPSPATVQRFTSHKHHIEIFSLTNRRRKPSSPTARQVPPAKDYIDLTESGSEFPRSDSLNRDRESDDVCHKRPRLGNISPPQVTHTIPTTATTASGWSFFEAFYRVNAIHVLTANRYCRATISPPASPGGCTVRYKYRCPPLWSFSYSGTPRGAYQAGTR